jgi:hypothetical protein
MSIAVTPTYLQQDVRVSGGQGLVEATLAITGLTAAAANTIPHGLPRTPQQVVLVPGANGLWGQTSPADATNIYVTVGTGGATAGTIYAKY